MSNNVSKSAVSTSARALSDLTEVSALLLCSKRHVIRMAERGLMPPPVRLGSLVRWQRGAIDSWIAKGCPAVRRGKEVARGT
jgi:predicted DNA-binding transcriptional regulator AlpA